MSRIQQLREKYGSPKYAPPGLPYMQVLNNDRPEHSGFFITESNALIAGLKPTSKMELYTAQFQNPVRGYRFTEVKLAVITSGSLVMFDRNSKVKVGNYDQASYNPELHLLKRKHVICMLDDSKHVIHEMPIQFNTSGSFCANFGEELSHFRREFVQAFGMPRGPNFHALTIFCLKTDIEEKGRGSHKASAVTIVERGKPTPDNWPCFFLGETDAEGFIENALEKDYYLEFGIHG